MFFVPNREGQIVLPFPKESSLSSHMSRQAMFPKPQRTEYDFQNNISSPTPPPIIINKAMGSFARREVVTPMVNSRTTPPPTQQVRPVLVRTYIHSQLVEGSETFIGLWLDRDCFHEIHSPLGIQSLDLLMVM